ncbi:MAG: hypothetical protein L0I76_26775 [Pseudonocardia sp.]|nr:hypothetical protein [Pseudonocardia sp.]
MYGDTHIDPAPLFDPSTAAPPADALDVYFHPPLSLSLVADMFARADVRAELDQLRQVYADITQQALIDVQRKAGYVANSRGRAIPARLELTALVEDTVPGEPSARLHSHIYVGRTAVSLENGERYPLALGGRFSRGVDATYVPFLRRIVDDTTAALGFVWMEQGGPADDQEIIEPPPDQWDGHDLVVCPGGYGPREQLLADAQWRAAVAKSWRLMTAKRERQRRTG